MTRLWDKGTPLDQRVLRYTAGEDHSLDNRLVAYDVRASIAHAEMLNAQGLLSAADPNAIRKGLDEIAALRLYLRDVVDALEKGALAVADALDDVAKREGHIEIPGYTHMQQAMPSSVALWAHGFSAELRDDATSMANVRGRVSKSPLGSAAGYGTPNLPLDRASTSSKLNFEQAQEPVTAVQLSRGKAEAQLLFEIAMLMQDVGRLSADLLLFYTQEFSFVTLPDAFTTGSSIMPQKRNPDVFELIRGRTATAQASLFEVLGIVGKLPSGYQRDLQLIKAPLFRSIDVCLETLDILPPALSGLKFRPEKIRLDASIHAAAQANELVVKEGIPFREAYRRVGAKLKKE
jgi:argininosuccinate lyase